MPQIPRFPLSLKHFYNARQDQSVANSVAFKAARELEEMERDVESYEKEAAYRAQRNNPSFRDGEEAERLARAAANKRQVIEGILKPDLVKAREIAAKKQNVARSRAETIESLISSTGGSAKVEDVLAAFDEAMIFLSDHGIWDKHRAGTVVEQIVRADELPSGDLSATYLRVRFGANGQPATLETASALAVKPTTDFGVFISLQPEERDKWLRKQKLVFPKAYNDEPSIKIALRPENREAIKTVLMEANQDAERGMFNGRLCYVSDVYTSYSDLADILDEACELFDRYGVTLEHRAGAEICKTSRGREEQQRGPATSVTIRLADDGETAILENAVSSWTPDGSVRIRLQDKARAAWLLEQEAFVKPAPPPIRSGAEAEKAAETAIATILLASFKEDSDREKAAAAKEAADLAADLAEMERAFDEAGDVDALLGLEADALRRRPFPDAGALDEAAARAITTGDNLEPPIR